MGRPCKLSRKPQEAYVKLLQHLNIPIMIMAVTQVSEKETLYELTISMPQGWEEDPAFLDLYICARVLNSDDVRDKAYAAFKLYQRLKVMAFWTACKRHSNSMIL